MSGGLDAILAKRQRQPQAPDAPRDPTSEQRSELHKHRNKLTRAADDASFEQAAMEFDGLLDAISEGVGKAHAISQEECDAEASWLYDVVDQRTKTMPPTLLGTEVLMDPSPLTPMPSSAPPKKKPRTSLGGLSNPSTPGEKREIVTWTKFHTIPAADMGISPENAQSVEKETLKASAKQAKTYVTAVDNARELIRRMTLDLPGFSIDPLSITSDLVTTRTVKSDHLKFWYLKPNFKDKDVDLLLRVARHKTGLYWDVSHGVQTPAATPGKDMHGLGSMGGLGGMGALGGMGSLGGMGAMSVSAANAMSAHHAAVTLANTADAEASALALLSVPAGSVQSPGFAPTAGADIAVVDAVVVSASHHHGMDPLAMADGSSHHHHDPHGLGALGGQLGGHDADGDLRAAGHHGGDDGVGLHHHHHAEHMMHGMHGAPELSVTYGHHDAHVSYDAVHHHDANGLGGMGGDESGLGVMSADDVVTLDVHHHHHPHGGDGVSDYLPGGAFEHHHDDVPAAMAAAAAADVHAGIDVMEHAGMHAGGGHDGLDGLHEGHHNGADAYDEPLDPMVAAAQMAAQQAAAEADAHMAAVHAAEVDAGIAIE